MALIDGKKIANEIYENLAKEVSELKEKHTLAPKLAVIMVGDNPASLSYIKQKRKACEKTGIEWVQFDYDKSLTQAELLDKIEELNQDYSFHGILVQLPLPEHFEVPKVIRAIDPHKDA